MRVLVALLAVVLWSGMYAQTEHAELEPGALGTREGSPVSIATPASAGTNWLQVTLALVVVAVGLRYGLPKLLRWAGKTGDGALLDGQVRVIETRAVPNGSLMLVKVRDRLLLIGSSPQGMQLLADLTPVSPPRASAVANTEFEELLRRAQPATLPPDPEQSVREQVRARLEQTQRRLTQTLGGERRR